MTPSQLEALASAVQHNCDLSDALHAQELSLCTYLLEMREQFRWARGLPLGQAPQREEVGRWIAAHEARWESLLDAPDRSFRPLPVGGGVDPFDEEAVNEALRPHGWAYGAGIGRFGRAVFVLARVRSDSVVEGHRVTVCSQERARGLNPPPAASRSSGILIRQDALKRWLWTRIELAARRAPGDTLLAAIEAHGTPADPLETLERMTESETETLLLHELGERRAGALLGDDWERMLADAPDRRAELVLRAIRDLLADALVTLPALLERDAAASIHFWFSSFEGFRRQLAPELLDAYAAWRRGDSAALAETAREGSARWLEAARALLDEWRAGGRAALGAAAARLGEVEA